MINLFDKLITLSPRLINVVTKLLDQVAHLFLIVRFFRKLIAQNSLALIKLFHVLLDLNNALFKIFTLLYKLIDFASAQFGRFSQLPRVILHLLVFVEKLASLFLDLIRSCLELLQHALHCLPFLALLFQELIFGLCKLLLAFNYILTHKRLGASAHHQILIFLSAAFLE